MTTKLRTHPSRLRCYIVFNNGEAGITAARMVSSGRGAAGKRANCTAMVQSEWDQAKHILQSVEESAGTILGFTTGDRAARHIQTSIRYHYQGRIDNLTLSRGFINISPDNDTAFQIRKSGIMSFSESVTVDSSFFKNHLSFHALSSLSAVL